MRSPHARSCAANGDTWNVFKNISSPDGDVLYGSDAGTGDLLGYRYLEATGTWVDTGGHTGKVIGHGWSLAAVP